MPCDFCVFYSAIPRMIEFINRGKIMRFILYFLFLTLISSCQNTGSLPATSSKNTPSILQGLTTAKTSQISILRHISQNYNYTLTPETPFQLSTKKAQYSDWVVDHLSFNQLELNTDYSLSVLNKEKVIDQRSFKSLDLNNPHLSIAVASCMDYRKNKFQQQMWNEFSHQNTDLHFFIGDNVYGDAGAKQKAVATPEELWDKYVRTRNILAIYKNKKLTPTLATWDDHDFGNNGGGENYPYKEDSLYTFNAFFAQAPISSSNYEKGPGISFVLKTKKQNFYFMDNRFFRTNKKTKPDYHWGDCLLYTSPSPRDRQKSRMPSSA